MRTRGLPVIVMMLLLPAFAPAKEKKSPVLPNFVTEAQTVAVVILPGASESLSDPNASRRAQDEVEAALTKWGRMRIVMSPQSADLVIAVRKGKKALSPTVSGPNVNDRPVILQPGDTDIRIGGQRGQPPSTTRDPSNTSEDSTRLGTSVTGSDDLFEVYQGNTRYPLDGIVVWRYSGRDGLKSPNVPAVAAFQKAIEDSVKQQKNQQSKKP